MSTHAPMTVVERPPEGPARGALAAPVWLVVLGTVGLVIVCGVMLARSLRRRTK